MGLANRILPYYTYDDYCKWEGRWELIEGIPYAMSPAPRPKHQRIVSALIASFHTSLKKVECKKCRVYDFIDYVIEEHTVVQPDVLIVCGSIEGNFLNFPPSLVIEVLSPSTALKDRNTKYELYQREGVPYYLIVDTDRETIEIYALVNDVYTLQNIDDSNCFEFHYTEGCKATTNFSEVWD